MSRYSKAQLYAISKSYSNKRKNEIEKKAAEMEITEIFHNQYFYKTLGGFVNAYGSKRFKQACESAKMRLEECYADYIDADYIDTDFYSIKQVLRKIDEILK